jgi:hypothetical protein
VLQEAGMVSITKSFEANRPLTMCSLTSGGRRRFLDYLALLEQVVRDAAKPAGEDFRNARLRLAPE